MEALLTDNTAINWIGDTWIGDAEEVKLSYTDFVQDTAADGSTILNDYWTYPQVVSHYYTTYPIIEKSKVDVAFKILKALQDKKIINVTKVKMFIELVDEISNLL